MDKTILHIDMDAFFASVEVSKKPELKGKPMAVTGSGQRCVIVSPTYQARSFGVKTGMTKYQAKKICKDIIFITANNTDYTSACNSIVKILYCFTPYIEIYSIDEFFIDITSTNHLFGGVKNTALSIKEQIRKKLNITCTVGISYNKLLAKIASDNNKPDGVFQIDTVNKQEYISALDVSDIWGIGPKTTKKLYNIGINTLGDLRKAGEGFLKRRFGAYGKCLYDISCGIGDEDVRPTSDERAKSIGHSITFTKDTINIKNLKKYLLELSLKVSSRLRREDFTGNCVSVTIRYSSFKTFSRQRSVQGALNTTSSIYGIAVSILKTVELKEPVRLLGVTVSGLKKPGYSSFLFREDEKRHSVDKVIDAVSLKMGMAAITYASLVNTEEHDKVISPAWRPKGSRHY